MPLPTYTQIAASLTKFFSASDKAHDIVNGADNATVEVESGVLPTFAKAIKDFQESVADLTSGPVTSSGGVSAIADAALSIAKTSGLQTALDGKLGISGSAATLTGLPLTTGVSGVLPVANGGTGSATQTFWDLSSNQTSAGSKTISTGLNALVLGQNSGVDNTDAGQLRIRSRSYVGNKVLSYSDRGNNDTFYVTDLGRLSAANGQVPSVAFPVQFGGGVAITGDTAGFAVYDRTNGANLWQFYSTGNTFRFYKNHGSGNAEPLTISASGVVTASAGVIQSPPASATPANNGQMLFEATSNTSVTLKLKGTDGTVRKVVLTLAP